MGGLLSLGGISDRDATRRRERTTSVDGEGSAAQGLCLAFRIGYETDLRIFIVPEIYETVFIRTLL